MTLLAAPPSTESLSRAMDREATKKIEVKFGKNQKADLLVHRDQVNVFLESSDEPVAKLRFGSSYSGALWMAGDIIGEFHKDPRGGPFTVVEIQDGFKKPHPRENVDPIEYLLERLANEAPYPTTPSSH